MQVAVFKDIIDQIHSKDVRDFVRACLVDVDEFFEKVPASVSGKYHPDKAREPGGLVWHVRRACWFGFNFIKAYKWEANDIRGDIVIASLILHDIGKKEKYAKYWEYIDHPKTATKMIQKHKALLPEKVFKLIEGCVLHHMGPFGGKFFIKPIPKYNILELIVYNSDYHAAMNDLKVQTTKGNWE